MVWTDNKITQPPKEINFLQMGLQRVYEVHNSPVTGL